MSEVLTPDLCVIGGGSGGLSVAAGAVQMGASVVLVEGHKMGGDCLNYGCVPSKALIAAGKAASAWTKASVFGVEAQKPTVDYAAAMDHVHQVIAGIEPHDSVERFEGLGVTVIQDWARFTGPDEVEAGGQRIRARRFVVASGSTAAVPPIPGLDTTPYLTNETLWSNRTLPGHLIVIGGGPIGMEMAQAHRRLGSDVTVIEMAQALGGDDPEVTRIALDHIRAEGVDVQEGTGVTAVSGTEGSITVELGDAGSITGTHLLVATGRKPNLDRLDLDKAGVEHDRLGIKVTAGLRSVSNSRIYAIGDVAGGPQFTHVANYHAGLVIRSALFRLPVKANHEPIPHVTYVDPEVAHVGLTEAAARERHGDQVEISRFDLAEIDRARAERIEDGLAKVVIGKRGRILGCSIVGPQAGELIQPWALALHKKMKIGDMAGHVVAYPTLGEVSKRAAGAYFSPRLFESPWVKRVVRLLARLG